MKRPGKDALTRLLPGPDYFKLLLLTLRGVAPGLLRELLRVGGVLHGLATRLSLVLVPICGIGGGARGSLLLLFELGSPLYLVFVELLDGRGEVGHGLRGIEPPNHGKQGRVVLREDGVELLVHQLTLLPRKLDEQFTEQRRAHLLAGTLVAGGQHEEVRHAGEDVPHFQHASATNSHVAGGVELHVRFFETGLEHFHEGELGFGDHSVFTPEFPDVAVGVENVYRFPILESDERVLIRMHERLARDAGVNPQRTILRLQVIPVWHSTVNDEIRPVEDTRSRVFEHPGVCLLVEVEKRTPDGGRVADAHTERMALSANADATVSDDDFRVAGSALE